jgi:hypothetical protein
MKTMIEEEYYSKEECNKDIGCQLEPCLLDMRAVSALSVLLLSEQVLKALKWLATHCLNLMKCVHHVGLDMGVFIGPKEGIY